MWHKKLNNIVPPGLHVSRIFCLQNKTTICLLAMMFVFAVLAHTYVRHHVEHAIHTAYTACGDPAGKNHPDAMKALARIDDLWLKMDLVLLLSVVPLTWWIIHRAMRRLNRITAVTRRFAEGDLSPRVRLDGDDEISALGRTMNAMADRLAASRAAMLKMNADLEDRIEERTRELLDLAMRDPLTNVYNRRHFTEILNHEFAKATRYNHDLAIMMIDLDNFKGVNDTHGHRAGDAVLQLTARQIMAQLRAADVAARYGGDEFIILLPHTSEEDAEAVGNRIRTSLLDAAEEELPKISVDISIGVASLKSTLAAAPEELIHEMDTALYAVKRSGKGRVAHAPAKNPHAGTRIVAI